MNANLRKTHELGQSIWYDSISRAALRGGELKKLIEEGVRGVTTNPSIFQKALSGSQDYDDDMKRLIAEGRNDTEIYDALTLGEVREACALFRPLWDESRGGDGFVSLEVNPLIADDLQSTVSEALRLWKALDCPNAMIKIPATEAGARALEEAVTAGVNVNSTLIFSLDQYTAVAESYIRALEHRAAQGLPLNQASVASVFVSRIDTAVDPLLAQKKPELAGRIAIANARAVYAKFTELFTSPRWKALAAKGARVQRPLWASTSVKNKAYSPTLYTDELIGPDTVNTLPPASLAAFMERGTPSVTVTKEGFTDDLASLKDCGISLDSITSKLLTDGLAAFAKSFRDMMAIIADKRSALAGRK
jgi:transaldolase